MASGVILAAPASGSGKTVLCAGLLAHFREHGLAVRAFKSGPDYIDPGFHRLATGHDCVNLDPWGMRPETLERRLTVLAAGADLVVGEGAMGLFDGARDGTGSTADLAARLGLPVVLVVDARGQGASVAALAEGFAGHRPDVTVAGIILNRVAGAAHERAASRRPRRAVDRGARCRAPRRGAEPALTPPRPRAGLRERGDMGG